MISIQLSLDHDELIRKHYTGEQQDVIFYMKLSILGDSY